MILLGSRFTIKNTRKRRKKGAKNYFNSTKRKLNCT